MAKQSLDPINKIVAEFQAGRINRRDFLRLLGGLSAGAAFASVPAVAARAPRMNVAPAAAAQPTPQLMIYGGAQDIASLDPFDRTDYSISAIMRQVYDRLFRFEGGWPQPVEPGLAQTWSASEDASEWTFEITDAAVFHDGTPLTADDVVFSYQQTLKAQKQRSSLLAGFLAPEGIVAKDSKTVVMTLTTPYGSFDRLLAFLEQPIVNKALALANEVDGDGGAAYLIDKDAGSGPFKVTNWQVGSSYELEAVEDYWQGWPGESHLSGVVWRKTEDVGTRKTGLLAGDFDVADTISATDIAEIDANATTFTNVDYGLLGGYLKYNTQSGPTADVNFRKFLAYSFDKQAFSDSQSGYVKLMTGPLPEGVPGYDAALDPQYSYDPVKAKEHLDMTEYKDGGIALDFVYVSGLDFEEAGGLILLAELQKYNITLNLVPKNWPDIVGACTAPETGPAIAFIFDQFPPLGDTWLIEKYSSKSWDRPTGGSFQACSFYKNEEVDAKLDTLRVTVDPDEAAKIVAEVQTQISEDAPDLPLYVSPNIVGFNKRVKGFVYAGDISVDFWRLWIDDAT
ncbi:MAG: ABC transporter substrate-binding protein [Chloroflexi bacterium]|nr:ABC transporter substrate-binding protein [Chloroflexota bacterium]MCC6893245.1 ABC transporter substrate-binding protein [Anaerolineae bacterium]